jgi:hypothetical protein
MGRDLGCPFVTAQVSTANPWTVFVRSRVRIWWLQLVPPTRFERAHTAPEAVALSPELRGLQVGARLPVPGVSSVLLGGMPGRKRSQSGSAVSPENTVLAFHQRREHRSHRQASCAVGDRDASLDQAGFAWSVPWGPNVLLNWPKSRFARPRAIDLPADPGVVGKRQRGDGVKPVPHGQNRSLTPASRAEHHPRIRGYLRQDGARSSQETLTSRPWRREWDACSWWTTMR